MCTIITLQWMLEKGVRFYVQIFVPFIPHPNNSRVQMDEEDTDQNKEHMGSEDFSAVVGWTQEMYLASGKTNSGGKASAGFFSGCVPCTSFDFLNWK